MRSPPSIVRIGGRSYALGLVWQVVTTPGVNLRRRARRDARDAVGADLVCLPGTLTPCFGLGARRHGHRAGMPAAAAALARSIPGHWIGVVPLPDRACSETGAPLYWLLAVRQQGIDPRTDLLGTEAALRPLFATLCGDGAPRLFVPEEWLPVHAGDARAPDLLAQIARGPRIRLLPANPFGRTERRLLAGVAAAGLLLAAAATGWRHWSDTRQHARVAAERAARAAPAPRRADLVLPAPQPWNQDAPVPLWAASCIDALRHSLLTVPGWRWTEAACDGRRALVRYARQDGSAALARQWWQAQRSTAVQLHTVSADQITIEAPMRGLRARAAEHLLSQGRVTALVLDRFEQARLPMVVGEIAAVAPPPREQDGQTVRQLPTAAAVQLSLSAVALPLDRLAAVLALVPGASLRQATLRPAAAVPGWDLTATIYVQP